MILTIPFSLYHCAGVSQPVHIAKLFVVHDGQAHNDGPAPARRWRHGGENHARHPHVQAGKTADGRIRVLESDHHVDSKCVYIPIHIVGINYF